MKVKRIVTNIGSAQPGAAERFYEGVFGLTLLMDQGWVRTYGAPGTAPVQIVRTYGAPGTAPVQISIASEGGSGTAVPDLSIEVDDIETALARVHAAGIALEYGPTTEPWGVRRFYVRDPFGKLVNVMQHIESEP